MSLLTTSGSKRTLLTYAEAAEYLGLGIRQLERAVQKRKIEHYRPNGHNVRFTREQLDAFLESARVSRREDDA